MTLREANDNFSHRAKKIFNRDIQHRIFKIDVNSFPEIKDFKGFLIKVFKETKASPIKASRTATKAFKEIKDFPTKVSRAAAKAFKEAIKASKVAIKASKEATKDFKMATKEIKDFRTKTTTRTNNVL